MYAAVKFSESLMALPHKIPAQPGYRLVCHLKLLSILHHVALKSIDTAFPIHGVRRRGKKASGGLRPESKAEKES